MNQKIIIDLDTGNKLGEFKEGDEKIILKEYKELNQWSNFNFDHDGDLIVWNNKIKKHV